MKRYDRSILGLMEHCNTGSWVKYDDVIDYEERLIACEKINKSLEDRLARFHQEVDTWKIVYSKEIETSQKLSTSNAVLASVIMLTFVVGLAALSIMTAMVQHS